LRKSIIIIIHVNSKVFQLAEEVSAKATASDVEKGTAGVVRVLKEEDGVRADYVCADRVDGTKVDGTKVATKVIQTS
jgi:hypothetical protein